MSDHAPIYYEDQQRQHFARCKVCGHGTEKMPTIQEAEDEWRKHLKYVERVRAYLGTRNPSLKSQRDYFADRAVNDPDKKQRPIWQQLADELSVRLGESSKAWDQEQLPI